MSARFAQALHFVTTRQTRERDKRAVMGLLGGSWDAALDGGDPERYVKGCQDAPLGSTETL
eukprot:969251-Pelagomonas_calceolata.AAC.3